MGRCRRHAYKREKTYQVKHTRDKNNLTFGTLVEVDDKGNSLLGNLIEGAKNSGLLDPKNELILYTNHEEGSRWSTRENSKRHPPLLEFWNSSGKPARRRQRKF